MITKTQLREREMIPYTKYKDSGIKWIGDVPDNWNIKRIKHLGNIVNGYAFKSNEFADNGTRVMKISNIQTMRIDWSDESFIDKKYFDELPLFRVKKGDIVFALTRPIISTGIKVAINTSEDPILLNQRNALLNIENKKYQRFLYYILVNQRFTQSFDSVIDKTGQQPNISSIDIGNLSIPFPPEELVITIANFLDKKTSEIDKTVTKKEKLIEFIEEERKTVIKETVTKGLNPNVQIRPSGVDWIGDIPKHWKLLKIKHTSYVKGRVGWKGLTSDEFLEHGYSYLVTGTDFKEGKVNWQNCYQIDKERYEEDPYIQLKENDLLITKDGTIGKTAIVEGLEGYACLNSGIFVVRPLSKEFRSRFLYYILNSDVFTQFNNFTNTGSTIKHLYQNVFVEFQYPMPPYEEQTKIIEYLVDYNEKTDLTIKKIRKEIELLKEYKQALIFEAVTGKIDVHEEGKVI